MDIRYLKQLSNYPTIRRGNSDYVFTLESISETEIKSLEVKYNNGKSFPIALKELLFLAGKYCYVLAYSLNSSQEEMQDRERRYLLKDNKTIDRPFFVIDTYNDGDQFLFIYLDEGDDPIVYEVLFYEETEEWLHSLNKTLSQFIDVRLNYLLSGQNPF